MAETAIMHLWFSNKWIIFVLLYSQLDDWYNSLSKKENVGWLFWSLCLFYQEKEKEAKRLSLVSSTPWSSMMVALHHMAIAEKTYFSLPFLVKKFFRKDVGFILKAYILEKENNLFVQNFNGFCTYKSVTKSMLSLGNDLILLL